MDTVSVVAAAVAPRSCGVMAGVPALATQRPTVAAAMARVLLRWNSLFRSDMDGSSGFPDREWDEGWIERLILTRPVVRVIVKNDD
jgi:hypothetical protein